MLKTKLFVGVVIAACTAGGSASLAEGFDGWPTAIGCTVQKDDHEKEVVYYLEMFDERTANYQGPTADASIVFDTNELGARFITFGVETTSCTEGKLLSDLPHQ